MDIGSKINQLRKKNGLTQEEVAHRCELSKGFISQVERGLTSPSIATLIDILECLGTNLKDFFNETVDEKVVFTKDDVFEKEHEESGHMIRWLIPNAQKNDMEPILVEINPDGKSQLHTPHEGEEFGYIISGSVVINLGYKKFKAKKGDSFYFKATAQHWIENTGKNKAIILWVVSPPSF
ncbi:Cro/Cl family transcriptional regulator [Candidatus Epulonipiscium fishelsonii]|uniref:Cro/Cl family transcriptional regulator n=1 Tax=Candidatus Epulonipiscium fishelsonii TaxID=77094 RepID=A0ACC8XF25_9FIRM|nr:Cro/Cl family transcriptional regulator [Epulopiscium sp. SCG-B11WGA-EpuloA1]